MAEKLLDRYGNEHLFDAINLEFDNSTNGFIATNAQTAIEEVNTALQGVSIVNNGTGFDLIKADATTNEVRFNTIDTGTPNPKLQITVGGTIVQTIDLNLNDIQIDNAGSDFDLTDDSLTFLETNGNSATISFAKYNVNFVVNVDGNIEISQNGNLLGTISQNTNGIAYDNTTSGLTATNVQAAIDEIVATPTPTESRDEYTATASQTIFTLSATPIGDIHFYRNGVRIINAGYSWIGTTVTYIPIGNGGYDMVSGDRVNIEYEAY